VGLLKDGDPADFIVVRDLVNFEVLQTYVNGELVAQNGESLIETQNSNGQEVINYFKVSRKSVEDFEWPLNGTGSVPAIEALDGQLITNKITVIPKRENGMIVSDPQNDLLKIVVVNRYANVEVSKSLIRNFGLKQGALASSVAHDSHNIVAVGVDDESICQAVNLIIANKGGISCIKENLEMVLPLPVGGLMSAEDGYRIAELYSLIDRAAKEAGSKLSSPFMTLSFMALLVIPHLKLSDKGLFDGDKFQFV
jgi:adenine deaminase